MDEITSIPDDTPRLGRILMIEDEPFDQRLYQRVLNRSGLADEVAGFTNPLEGLEHLLNPSNLPFDLVMLDINMPQMNGLELLRRLHEEREPRQLPAVALMLTVPLGPAQSAVARSYPIVRAFVNKPLHNGQLVPLAHHLHRKQQQAAHVA